MNMFHLTHTYMALVDCVIQNSLAGGWVSSDKVALAVGGVEVALRNETADPLGFPWHPLRNQAFAQETNLVPDQKVALS